MTNQKTKFRIHWLLLIAFPLACQAAQEPLTPTIHDAVWLLDIEDIGRHLDSGASVTDRNDYKSTPLHEAASMGAADVVEFLLSHGADTGARDYFQRTPLHEAARAFQGGGKVASIIIEHGAEVDSRDQNDWTPLHVATLSNRTDVAKVLLDAGAEVNAQTESGSTPLHLLSDDDDIEMAQILLAAGANINATNEYGATPLGTNYGEQSGEETPPGCPSTNEKLDALLMSQGAILGKPTSGGKGNQEPEKIDGKYWSIDSAVMEGDLSAVQKFIERGDLSTTDGMSEGIQALGQAATYGYRDIVGILLDAGVPVNSTDTISGYTALHSASFWGHPGIVNLLLERNADINAKVMAETHLSEVTPLHCAAMTDQLEVIEILLEHGADFHARDREGQTALHCISDFDPNNRSSLADFSDDEVEAEKRIQAWENWYDSGQWLEEAKGIVNLLLDHGAELDAKDNEGRTPLQVATADGRPEVVAFLKSLGSEVSFIDCVRTGDVKKAAEMLKNGPGLVNEIGEWGKTPLHEAVETGNPAMVDLLLEDGANVNAKAAGGATPIFGTLYEDGRRSVPVQEKVSIVRALIKAGADINAKVKEPHDPNIVWTPLDLAALMMEAPEIAQVLVEASAEYTIFDVAATGDVQRVKNLISNDPSLIDSVYLGGTPLGLAAEKGKIEVVKYLVEAGANVNATNSSNWTALHGAAWGGHDEIVRILLDHGADPSIKDSLEGETALDVAKREGHEEIVKILSLYGVQK